MTEEKITWRKEVEEYINDKVADVWQLETRPDLEKDCVEYVLDKFDDDGYSKDDDFIKYLVIQFLSNHCTSTYSSEDLEFMANAEEQRRKNEQSL